MAVFVRGWGSRRLCVAACDMEPWESGAERRSAGGDGGWDE